MNKQKLSLNEIDEKVREYYLKLTAKIKGYKSGNLNQENSDVVNKCLDYYFQLKEQNQNPQLELF